MSGQNPLVSIIIPTYNEERNIGRLLRSIKSQTYSNCETIVVDDGSNDSTIEIARRFTRNVFPRAHQERSIQRNFGAGKARGKYLLFLDADMELTPKVVNSCLVNLDRHKALVIPERTVGQGFLSAVRRFEREMYMGDPTIEVARFFDRRVFREFKGYDPSLTGAEDYDLPKRISEKYTIGRSKEYILHHEEIRTLATQLKKKFYYARRSALYAQKHPDLISKQGILIWRKAYFRNWRKFARHPLLGISLIFVRLLETISATLGYVAAVGIFGFIKTVILMFRNI